MVNVKGQVEIAAPPEKVREVFLDFARYPQWSQAHIKSVEVPSQKAASQLQEGDKLKVTLSGMTFSPVVNSNTEQEFSWTGALPLNLFSGKHTFRFEPSATTAGHTTFHDGEEFAGILTTIMGVMPSMRGEQTSKQFDAFDREFTARVESLHGQVSS